MLSLRPTGYLAHQQSPRSVWTLHSLSMWHAIYTGWTFACDVWRYINPCWLIDWLIKSYPPPACDLLIFQQCVRILHELLHNCWTVLWKYIRNTTIRECMHSVTGRHFRSRDKNGGHTIRCALCFKELELMRIKVLHYGNRNFRSFYLLWPWLWPDDLRIRTWSVFPGDTPTGVVLGRQSPSSVQGPSIYGHR